MTQSIQHEITARSIDQLPALEPLWTSLRDAHGAPTPNSEPHRFAATVAALGPGVEPHVTVLGDSSNPRAMIIGRCSTRSLGCRLGYLSLPGPTLRCLDVVYGGIITDGSEPAKQAVCNHLRRALEAHDVDHVMVNHLPRRHELFDRLAGGFSFIPSGLDGNPRPHWRFRFADGPFENTMARFSRKHRYNLRRANRLLEAQFGGDAELEVVTSAEDLDGFVEEAVRITGSGWQGKVGGGFGNAELQKKLLARAAQENRLRSYLLRGAGAAIAFQAGVLCDGIYHLQSTGFLPRYERLSPGQVMLVRVMRDLRDWGVGAIDYGFGDAAYKRTYGTESWDEATIYLYASTPQGRSARFLHLLTSGVARLATGNALADRVKKQWRKRLAA
jgi:hypothetical protein